MKTRGSGILMHITSLPSAYGIGDLGPGAYFFADFLAQAGQSYWQILPLNPTYPGLGNSPYSSTSAFAGNPLLISPERLYEEGFASIEKISTFAGGSDQSVDYPVVSTWKMQLLKYCYQDFRDKIYTDQDYLRFKADQKFWLDDFALFTAIKKAHEGQSWIYWNQELQTSDPSALELIHVRLGEEIERQKFIQYLFHRQWFALKKYCNGLGVQLIGDVPIYVSLDSAEVWAHPEIFKLDEEYKPTVVAGVPPDYFSETGQLWGNPVFDWSRMQKNGYIWWQKRLEQNFSLFDLVRIDHFRGFISYWEVPAGEQTAINGRWQKVPAAHFFHSMFKRFSCFPVIVEDLGLITADVSEFLLKWDMTGMKVLLFAFGESSVYLPHTYPANCVAYTGTHDTNTLKGWFEHEAGNEEKERLFKYLGKKVAAEQVPWELIRLASMSVANTTIFPLQDILSLGAEARMNIPATTENNWCWRVTPEQLTDKLAGDLLEITQIYDRI